MKSKNVAQAVSRRLFPVLALAAASICATATAQTYPDKPIRLVVPYAAGGSTDVTARLMAKSLSARLGQPVVVDNRAGAGGSIGQETAAKAAPDGYTLLFSAAGPLTVTPHTYPRLGYDPAKGFDPVILVATQPLLLVVNPATRINSVSELIKEAGARQGKLNYGSFGNGSAAHLAAESFKMLTKADMMHVPYKGSSPALTGLMAGDIDLMFDVFSTAASLAETGKLRAIAITSKKRSPKFPDVPTMEEAGVTGLDAGTWFGMLAPAGTPKDVVKRLNQAANAALAEPELRNTLVAQGADIRGGSPEEFGEFFNAEFNKMGRLVKAAGVKVD